MFELGELVATKEKGPPAQGIVRACYEAEFYKWAKENNLKHLKWAGKIDLNIEEDYYTVEFPEPIRVITLDEIRAEFGWQHAEALEYLERLPKHKYVEYPESCLERIEY